jgi:hypothetical protein
MNHGLEAKGVFDFYHADYRIGTTFDSGWHASLQRKDARSGNGLSGISHAKF